MATLDITGWGFLLGLGLLVVASWSWVALRWRRHHRVRTVTVALLLTLLLAGDGVNSYFSDLPHITDVLSAATGTTSWKRLKPTDLQVANYGSAARRAPRGGVVRLHVPDRGSGFGPSTALVYVPPQYFTEPDRRFPVVYLLHGSPGTPADWIRGGGAERAGMQLATAGHPTLIVMPRMSHHWLDDPECVDGIHLRDETHLLADVLPSADSALRTVPDATSRIIAGMSAGGFCALNIGLRNPDVFGAILDLSGLDRPTHSGGMTALFGPGLAGRAAAAANDRASTSHAFQWTSGPASGSTWAGRTRPCDRGWTGWRPRCVLAEWTPA